MVARGGGREIGRGRGPTKLYVYKSVCGGTVCTAGHNSHWLPSEVYTLSTPAERQTGKINIRQNVCKLLNCGQKSLLLIPARAASLFRLSLLFKEILSQWVHWFYQRRSGIRKNPTKRSKISFDFGDILLFYRLNVPLSEPAGQFRFETNNNNWHH